MRPFATCLILYNDKCFSFVYFCSNSFGFRSCQLDLDLSQNICRLLKCLEICASGRYWEFKQVTILLEFSQRLFCLNMLLSNKIYFISFIQLFLSSLAVSMDSNKTYLIVSKTFKILINNLKQRKKEKKKTTHYVYVN